MEDRAQLIPNSKLIDTLALIDKEEKIDKTAVTMISQFTEKYINDILTRASLLAKHKGNKAISEDDVRFVLETEFDYFIPTGK
ncbi:transcription initiation factor TFIID subunit 12 [Nematocida homosporus]|uniref:transcription initiation factor TFIID subunit 12 n=1 Tax=Nematocida homosporus TaxID=1912981 RepID=UPI00222029B8|nr:transcription initiation factor TFIID subunit 12 [Nematocida homosporus]KAI5187575.1 transcription initiation factor TFIID subunit 12 [Nematocida homosporus]